MHPSSFHVGHPVQDGRLYAVLAAAGFSMKAIFVKLGYAAAPVDPVTLLAIRMGCALPLFLGLLWLARAQGTARLAPGDIVRILLLGFSGYYLSSLFDFIGLQTISAGLERLILYLYPSLVLLFQVCLTRQRPDARTLQALGICYLGLGIGFVHDMELAGWSREVLAGAAWILACAVTYALYYIGTGAVVGRIGSMRLAGLAGSAACVFVLAHFAAVGDLAALAAVPTAVWINGALMALVSTVLPIWWTALAISRLGAARTAAFGNLGPVLTIVFAWLLLGERLSAWQLGGMALVLFGVSRLRPAPARTAPTHPSGVRP